MSEEFNPASYHTLVVMVSIYVVITPVAIVGLYFFIKSKFEYSREYSNDLVGDEAERIRVLVSEKSEDIKRNRKDISNLLCESHDTYHKLEDSKRDLELLIKYLNLEKISAYEKFQEKELEE